MGERAFRNQGRGMIMIKRRQQTTAGGRSGNGRLED